MPAPSETSVAAADRAAAAARRAGVEIADLDDIAELRQVAELFIAVWRTSVQEAPCAPELLRALVHSGNYVAGARLDGRIVGAAVAFLQLDRGALALHSHITGVSAAVQGRSVGFALKLHQRAWALARGIRRVDWTFDPLVRRNAWFNLVKLGAEGVGYLPRFYGEMTDAINAGDETDRCLVSWRLESERAVAAAAGRAAAPSLEALLAAGAAVVLAESPDGRPAESASPDSAGTLLAWVPPDAVALRASEPALALRWRRALRSAMGSAVRRGFVAAGMTRSGWYVLERSRQETT